VSVGYYNSVRVHDGWAAILKPNPFRILNYMALRARDDDQEPWFGLGHEVLAVKVLGLKMSERTTVRGQQDHDMQLRRVRRAITQLIKEIAIETRDHAFYTRHGASHVVYRLYLDGPGLSRPPGLPQLPEHPPGWQLPSVTGTPQR
jgi:hypothetical protein